MNKGAEQAEKRDPNTRGGAALTHVLGQLARRVGYASLALLAPEQRPSDPLNVGPGRLCSNIY
jgi:hypothetical protein